MLKKKAATLWAAVLWALIFVEVSIVMFIPGLETDLVLQKVIHYIILPFLVIFCAYKYFENETPSLRKGFVLGVYFLMVGIILDLVITVPLFVQSFNYFIDWTLYLGFITVVATTTAFGHIASMKKKAVSARPVIVKAKRVKPKKVKKVKPRKAKKPKRRR